MAVHDQNSVDSTRDVEAERQDDVQDKLKRLSTKKHRQWRQQNRQQIQHRESPLIVQTAHAPMIAQPHAVKMNCGVRHGD